MNTQTQNQMFRFQDPPGPETGLERSDINSAFPFKSYGAVSKSDVLDPPSLYFKTARVLSIVGIAAYGIFRSVEIIARNSDYRLALGVSLFCGCTIAALLLFMGFVKDKAKLAFYVPFITFVFLTAGSVYLKEFEYFFMIWLGICGIGSVYHHFKKLLSFSITSSVIIFFLFLFNFITDNTAITLSQALTRWFFAIFTAAFFLAAEKFSLETNNRTAGFLNVFSTVIETTPNFMAVLDERNGIVCISKRFAEFIALTRPAAVTGRPLPDLIEDPDFKTMLTEALAAGDLFEGTKEIKREGNSRLFRIFLKRLEGDVSGFFIDITDITPPEAVQNPITGLSGENFEQQEREIVQNTAANNPEEPQTQPPGSGNSALEKSAEYRHAV